MGMALERSVDWLIVRDNIKAKPGYMAAVSIIIIRDGRSLTKPFRALVSFMREIL